MEKNLQYSSLNPCIHYNALKICQPPQYCEKVPFKVGRAHQKLRQFKIFHKDHATIFLHCYTTDHFFPGSCHDLSTSWHDFFSTLRIFFPTFFYFYHILTTLCLYSHISKFNSKFMHFFNITTKNT